MTTGTAAINKAFEFMRANPGEFLCPGITEYRSDFTVLKELCAGLESKFREKDKNPPAYFHTDVQRPLARMALDVQEGLDGFTLVPEDTDRILDSMAFVEKYFLN